MSTDKEPELTNYRHKAFADRYLSNGFNGTDAYMCAYDYKPEQYYQARVNGSRLLTNDNIKAYIDYHLQRAAVTRDEWLALQRQIAFTDLSQYMKREGKRYYFDLDLMKDDGLGWLVTGLTYNQRGEAEFKTLDRDKAFDRLGRALNISDGNDVQELHIRVTVDNAPND